MPYYPICILSAYLPRLAWLLPPDASAIGRNLGLLDLCSGLSLGSFLLVYNLLD